MRGVKINGEPPEDWLEDAKAVTEQLLEAEETEVDPATYKLELLPALKKVAELPTEGTSLLSIGEVEGKIHVRAFDGDSEYFVNAVQPKRDHDESLFNQLHELLEDNWERAKLKPLEVREVFRLGELVVRRFLTSAIIEQNEGLWRDDRVRNWLLSQFNNKCWYSEAQDSVSSIHVDHFRPKGRVKDDQTKTVDEGYWWLAFDWKNYRIGGELLNVKKSDIFPHSDAVRATHTDLESTKKECPVLLDPIWDQEARLISYDWQDEETCVAVPAGDISEDQVARVDRTIDVIGLNRLPRLNVKRAQYWDRCKMAIADYEGAHGPQYSVMVQQAKAKVTLQEMTAYESEFSSVCEACIWKNAPEPLAKEVFSRK